MTLDLPPMRTLGPARISRRPIAAHPAYPALLADAAATGCCPVWVDADTVESLAPPPDPQGVLAEIAGRDAADFLRSRWPRNCPLCGCRDSFDTFTGLAPATEWCVDPVEVAGHSELAARSAHLAVVPARRPADAVAVLGWTGTCNYHSDVAGLATVLRSWEDRYGAFVVLMNRAVLWLSVAAPPVTPQECRAVAAEHFAFCPDVDEEDPRPLTVYANTLAGRGYWRFWWD